MATDIAKIAGKTFVNPGIAPPEASDKVSEPLVGQLVRDQGSSVVLHRHYGLTRVYDEIQLSEKP